MNRHQVQTVQTYKVLYFFILLTIKLFVNLVQSGSCRSFHCQIYRRMKLENALINPSYRRVESAFSKCRKHSYCIHHTLLSTRKLLWRSSSKNLKFLNFIYDQGLPPGVSGWEVFKLINACIVFYNHGQKSLGQ